MSNQLQIRSLTIPFSQDVNFGFETRFEHGSAAWLEERKGLTIGSSEIARTFSGIVTGSARKQLCEKFQGVEQPSIPSYVQAIMDEGTKMEPYLIKEVSDLLGVMILRANLYKLPYRTHGVQEISTPDGIVMTPHFPHRVALVEIKWRPTSTDDCGWGPARDRIDIKVWCQAQHQMFVTGIHRCLLYSGSPSGARRMWKVDYCGDFRPYFTAALKACVEGVRGDSHGTCEVKLGRMMSLTTKLEYVKLPRDDDIEEIKGGAETETQGGSEESTETLNPACECSSE